MSENVLERLASGKRLPILFIGSGISKRYLYRYPNWEELLELSFKKYNSDLYQLQKYRESFSRSGLSAFEVNTKVATIIENDFNAAFFDRKSNLILEATKIPIGYEKVFRLLKCILLLTSKK